MHADLQKAMWQKAMVEPISLSDGKWALCLVEPLALSDAPTCRLVLVVLSFSESFTELLQGFDMQYERTDDSLWVMHV